LILTQKGERVNRGGGPFAAGETRRKHPGMVMIVREQLAEVAKETGIQRRGGRVNSREDWGGRDPGIVATAGSKLKV